MKKRVFGEDLLLYDWLAPDNRSTLVYKKWIMEALSLESYEEIEKRIRVFVPDYALIKKLLLQSDYIAVMPKVLINAELKNGKLAEIKPQWQIPHIEIEGFLMYLNTYSFPSYLDKFIKGIKESVFQ